MCFLCIVFEISWNLLICCTSSGWCRRGGGRGGRCRGEAWQRGGEGQPEGAQAHQPVQLQRACLPDTQQPPEGMPAPDTSLPSKRNSTAIDSFYSLNDLSPRSVRVIRSWISSTSYRQYLSSCENLKIKKKFNIVLIFYEPITLGNNFKWLRNTKPL